MTITLDAPVATVDPTATAPRNRYLRHAVVVAGAA